MSPQQHATDEITDRILEFLSAATGGRDIAVDQDYVAEGLIDSLLALELVTQVEVLFGVEVEVADLDLDNFRTAGRIAAFVRRKRGEPPYAGVPDAEVPYADVPGTGLPHPEAEPAGSEPGNA